MKNQTELFKSYLENEGLRESSINEHLGNLRRFNTWLAGQQLQAEEISYNDLLSYVHDQKTKGLNINGIQIKINSIRKYYEHLKELGYIEKNPATRLRLKGGTRKITQDILNYTELESLYNQYVQYISNDIHHQKKNIIKCNKRNAVILGLMTGQGLHSGELEKLRVEHVKIEQGIIYIPESARSNSRELKLSSIQTIPLYQYLTEYRKAFNPTDDRLFTGHLHNIVKEITDTLKGLNEKIHNAQQIRASVIMYWLKLYDKRQVQYMLGYRYISSLERYERQDVDTLNNLLLKHHPFA